MLTNTRYIYLFLTWSILLAGCAARLAQQSTEKKHDLEILGLGDSITEGGPGFFSYLFTLDSLLKQSGYHPRFVGPKTSIQSGDTLRHAAFSGMTAEFIAKKIDSIYRAYPAKLVLLHSGHNHFQEEKPVPGILNAHRAIIATIKKINPSAQVFVAGVVTAGKLPKYEYIPALDDALRNLVDSLKDPSMVYVDQRNNWNWNIHTISDKVHPNREGARIIAENWFRALAVSKQVQPAQPDSLLPAKAFTPRGGLPNFFSKLNSGKPMKIAFLGGSITRAGGGYRDQIIEKLMDQYPKTTFQEVMAAVSGTGSDFGACRLKQHVTDHQPDLVFVEFAVNDNRWRMKLVRETMEGIVRQLRKADAAMDICFVYTFSAENLPTLQTGMFPASVSAMENVAEHYNIPSIHMGLDVVAAITKGRMRISGKKEEQNDIPLFSLDGVHPLPETGHKMYTKALAKYLMMMEEKHTPVKHPLSGPLEAGNWENAGMVSLEAQGKFSGNWGTTDSVTKGKEYYSLMRTVYATASPEAALTVNFEGTRFGLADIMGPGTSAIELTIDQQPPRVISRFDAFSTYYRLNYFILTDLAPGKHTATIRLSPAPLNKAAILETRNVVVKDRTPYEKNVLYVGGILY